MAVDYTPTLGDYKELKPFRYWCQKVLPLVYDDSLSYYELLCKVVDYLNKTMEDVDTLHDDVDTLHTAYVQLQGYVNSYFDNLDVQEEINNKLNSMVTDGTFDTLLSPYMAHYQNELDVMKGRLTTLETQYTPGGTAGDAELSDIRVGYDGTIYPTAGDAVREQISNIHYDISPVEDYSLMFVNSKPDNKINKIITGYYINTSGGTSPSKDWCCTPFIDISDATILYGQNLGLGAYYDETKTFISNVTIGNATNTKPSNAKFIRVSILPTNINTAILSFHQFYRNFPSDAPTSWWKLPKKEYEEGYIPFTVQVNNITANRETGAEPTPEYINVDCVLSLPFKYKPVGEPCKLLMICHGAGRGVSGDTSWINDPYYDRLTKAFVSYGYAVFDCNGFNNNALGKSFWGNQKGLEAWRKAYLYVTNYYNVEKTFAIYAFSMGGLTAMNLAFQGFPNINVIAMGSPVLNLRAVWDATDGTQEVLKVLYNMGDSWDDNAVVGNNPYKHIITVDGTKYCPFILPPIKIWYGGTETGNTDNPAVEKNIAKDFVDAIKNSGGYAEYREVPNKGHEISYGGDVSTNSEIVYFIERYERSMPAYY